MNVYRKCRWAVYCMDIKILGEKIPERVAGIDLMERLFGVSLDEKAEFTFGAREEVVKEKL